MSSSLKGDFNPAIHFLGLIQKAIADGITRLCVHPDCPPVYLVPAEQAFYTASSDICELLPLCQATPFDLSVNPMPDWHPNTPNQGHDVQAGRTVIHRKTQAEPELSAHPLQELLWYAALSTSEGKLLRGSQAETPVRLMAAPDFNRLFHQGHEPALATFMLENTADLHTVATATGIALPKVFDFYNACAVIGLIDSENVFYPENYLLGLLEKAKTDRIIRRCTIPGNDAALILVPEEDKYYTAADIATVALFCAALLPSLEISAIDNNKPEQTERVQIGRSWVHKKKAESAPKLPGHPLSDLVFRAALYGSQGRLLPGHQLNQPVRLAATPDKTLLKESATIANERYIFPLTAFMAANKAMSLPEIAASTKQPLAKVIDFHNACAILGLLANQ